jgi:ribonuclease T1
VSLRRWRQAVLALLLAMVATLAACGAASGPDEIARSALPSEARETLERIDHGGPFPYRKDGTTFHNRERLLPQRERSYYREYTVRTPGRRDRGARRIVAGAGGERYYTDDHYRSFRQIRE